MWATRWCETCDRGRHPHGKDCVDVLLAQRRLLHLCGDTLTDERYDCILGLLANGSTCGAEVLHNLLDICRLFLIIKTLRRTGVRLPSL